MATATEVNVIDDELDWIQISPEPIHSETSQEKMMRKIKENPLVPIGCLATGSALVFGLYNFRTGNRRMSQLMMRTRILAQGFTVAALITGVSMACSKKK